jgi:hypothetical protein
MPADAADLLRDDIEELTAFRGRAPGTDAERRAATHLRRRLEEAGREADVEPIRVYAGWPQAHALHALAAVVGSVLSVDRPLLGTAIVGAAILLALADLGGLAQPTRRLFGWRASQNVVSREDGGRPGVLLLVAHYDAARTGALFGARGARARAWLGRPLRRPVGVFDPLVWSLLALLACTAPRVAGLEGVGLTVAQFVPTVALIAAIPLLLDVPLSAAVPGANDNASGVAAVLELAERHGDALEHFDVWVLLTGSEEGLMLGMRAWLRAHRRELDPAATVVVCVSSVGAGTPAYATREGLLLSARYHPTLVGICDEIADDHGARRFASRGWSDAHLARVRGLPAIRVSCLDERGLVAHEHLPGDVLERVDADAVAAAVELCSELVELVDERVGPDLEDEAGAGARAGDEED